MSKGIDSTGLFGVSSSFPMPVFNLLCREPHDMSLTLNLLVILTIRTQMTHNQQSVVKLRFSYTLRQQAIEMPRETQAQSRK